MARPAPWVTKGQKLHPQMGATGPTEKTPTPRRSTHGSQHRKSAWFKQHFSPNSLVCLWAQIAGKKKKKTGN